MTLELNKVQEQVERMGRALAHRNLDLSERAEIAWQWLQALDDLDAIRKRIVLARERDVGFRGAAPAGAIPPDTEPVINEPVNRAYPLPAVPERATLVAVDGSQIYPSLHVAALYYLTNIGIFVYHHGSDDLPDQITEPRLHYTETMLRDQRGQVITNTAVNARRNVIEMQILARESWHRRDACECPLVALSDGPLLFWVGKDVPEGDKLSGDYLGAVVHLHDTHAHMQREHEQFAALAGYVDRPTSAFITALLHLMSLDESDVRRANLTTNGALEGLNDRGLMFRLLKPGERSALMVQQSPQNKYYHDRGANYEIAFFYLNVGGIDQHQLARVEIPMWVARDPAVVAFVHALVYDQCGLMWRYPYALTRADEIAVVRGHERTQLNEMIEIELRRNVQDVEQSEKLEAKIVRHGRTRYGQKKRGF